jgi:hypothetical protein
MTSCRTSRSPRLRDVEVQIVDVRLELAHLLLGHRKAEPLLGAGQRDPHASPLTEATAGREERRHLAGRVSLDEGILEEVGITRHRSPLG